jgi:hypothetical protein
VDQQADALYLSLSDAPASRSGEEKSDLASKSTQLLQQLGGKLKRRNGFAVGGVHRD